MNRTEIIHPIRRSYPAKHRLGLSFGACRLNLKANRPEIIAFLREYFKPFVGNLSSAELELTVHEVPTPDLNDLLKNKPWEHDDSELPEEWLDLNDGRIVRSRGSGMVFILGGQDHLVAGPCLENLGHLAKFINSRYMEWQLCRGYLPAHAAGVAIHNQGLALAGFPGMGKSTLALHLLNRGARFVSNNRILIKKAQPQPYMYGLAEWPRVNPGTLLHNPNLSGLLSPPERDYYAAFSQAELWTLEHKYEIPLQQCFGPDRVVLEVPLAALIILNWQAGPEPTRCSPVNLVERTDLWPAFITTDKVFMFPVADCRLAESSPETYLEYLGGCRVFELSGDRNFAKAVAACLASIEKGQG